MYSSVNGLPNTAVWSTNVDNAGVSRIDRNRRCHARRPNRAVIFDRRLWPDQLPWEGRCREPPVYFSVSIGNHAIKLFERLKSGIGRNKVVRIGSLFVCPFSAFPRAISVRGRRDCTLTICDPQEAV